MWSGCEVQVRGRLLHRMLALTQACSPCSIRPPKAGTPPVRQTRPTVARSVDGQGRQKERRQQQIAKGRNPNKKRGKQAQIYDEWDELAKEERLHKKLRQGKITKEQYKQLMYGDSKKRNSDYVLDDSDIEV